MVALRHNAFLTVRFAFSLTDLGLFGRTVRRKLKAIRRPCRVPPSAHPPRKPFLPPLSMDLRRHVEVPA